MIPLPQRAIIMNSSLAAHPPNYDGGPAEVFILGVFIGFFVFLCWHKLLGG